MVTLEACISNLTTRMSLRQVKPFINNSTKLLKLFSLLHLATTTIGALVDSIWNLRIVELECLFRGRQILRFIIYLLRCFT